MEIKCIYCNSNHKFSPFNVSKNIRYDIKQPLMRKDLLKNKYVIYVMNNNDINKYNPLTNNKIEKNDINDNDTIYWGGDCDIFIKKFGLMDFISKNLIFIDSDTILHLRKYILCLKWWDNLFNSIDEYNFNINSDNNDIIKLLDDINKYYKIININSCDYSFNNYNILIKKLGELIKRYNENKYKEDIFNQKSSKDNKIKEELEYLKMMEEKEINDIDNNINIEESFNDKFLSSLNKIRKSNNIKFLATIKPNENIIADMIIKLGECSKLHNIVDNMDNINKVKIWELYLKQKQEIKEGKKFKKSKNKLNIIEILRDNKYLIELTSKEQIQYKNIYVEYINNNNKFNKNMDIVLDEWQNEAIEYIRNGKSCLIKGPTSGGKTYIMMKGLDNIINMGIEQNVVYVSPTFHLAYQTYANIKVTFPQRKIAIITIELIHIPKDANIFIGTACELLNYFTINKKKFHVGIFDEIHVATILYCDDVSTKEKIRARAYAKLISKCDKQIIAASATIRNIDAMRHFIVNMINLDKKDKIRDEDIYIVNYNKRIIPLIEYRFINNSELQIIKRNEDNIEIDIPNIENIKGIINAENLFKLLLIMKEKDMIPTIVFESNDDNAWKTYINLIEYCTKNEEIDYKDYNEGLTVINNIITNYNTEYYKINSNILDNDIDISNKKKDITKNSNKSILYSILSKRNNCINKILVEYKTILKKSIINYNINNIESLSKIINIKNDIMNSILDLLDCNKTNLYKKYPNFYIIQSHVDMFNILSQIENLNTNVPDILMLFEYSKGSFYKFGNSKSVELLKSIREPGSDEEKWKQRKRMILLAEAQNIKPKDIDNIIDVIINGLQFGLAIINPSLPFIIQNIILENLKNKESGIVFASESMSMGINYPLRSVIIKSMSGYERLLPGKMIQMSGRCGRRGKDNQAHVIFWGIENASESNHIYIPPIMYPEHFLIDNIESLSGCIISNHEVIAIKLGEILLTKYFDNNMIDIKKMNDLDNDKEYKLLHKKYHVSKINKDIYLEPIIECIGNYLNFKKTLIDELIILICKIENDIILESFFINSFEKSQNINLLVNLMIELYNYYASCSNIEFLNFIEDIVNIFQKCEYKLIKMIT